MSRSQWSRVLGLILLGLVVFVSDDALGLAPVWSRKLTLALLAALGICYLVRWPRGFWR